MTAQLAVRVQPGARATSLVGWMADGTLKVRVSAAPEAGKANRAVEELLAVVAGVRASAVKVVRGQTSRAKRVEVAGLDEASLRSRITAALADAEGRDGG